MFFQLLSTKLKLVDKIMQSAYLCYFTNRAQKQNSRCFYLKSCSFLVKSNMATKKVTMFGDVTGLQQRHHPYNYTSSCKKDQRLPTEGKIVLKYCNISKTLGKGSNTPLYHGGGMALRVHVRPKV